MEKKLIFISDLHMNDERSLIDSKDLKYEPYGWLNAKAAGDLSDFVTHLSTTNDVAELIILGDMLDTWVCPVSYSPQTFEAVLSASQNQCVINAFKAIIAKGITLTYVVGNHDMLVDEAILQKHIPGIRFIGYGDDMKTPGIYTSGKLHGEHGNMYAMFNAPDLMNSLYHNLPLGYFISRIAASILNKHDGEELIAEEKEVQSEMEGIIEEVIRQFLSRKKKKDLVQGDGLTLAELVVDAICLARAIGEEQTIVLPDATEVTIKTVKEKYANLYREWVKMYGEEYAFDALMAEIGHLNNAARMLLKKGNNNVVLFGHTHKCELKNNLVANTIYANTGTWCVKSKPHTFVVSQVDPEEKKHYIRLMKWENNEEVPMIVKRVKL